MSAASDPLLEAWRARARDPEAWDRARASARVGPTLHPGEIVGDRYRLVRAAGDGPLAATWSAVDLVGEGVVSLKVLHGHQAVDPNAITAFRAAAEAGEGADHRPGVADEGGEWLGFHWFAVHGDPGDTLQHSVATGRLGPAAALEVVVEAGRALAALHESDRLHGLVSPEAIRVDGSGTAQLHDAGLFTPGSARSVVWLAPERLDPKVAPDRPADVYGLAMSLLFALNGGELPFWVWRAPERLVEELEPPPPARSALLEAVSWDPAERRLSARALIDAVLGAPELRRSLAIACLETGRPQEALDHLDALREVSPGDPDLLAARARALDALEAPAGLAWQEALDAHHTRAQARVALEALIERSSGAELVARGRALLPLLEPRERPPLQHRLGRVLLDQIEDPDAALPLLEAALEGGFKKRGLRKLVEKLRTERGDWVDVQRHLEQRGELADALAVSRYALRADTRDLRLRLLASDEDPEALRDEALASLAEEQSEPLFWMERLAATGFASASDAVRHASWLAASDRGDAAREVLHDALAEHPTHLGLLCAVAEAERRSGELAAALAHWEQVAEQVEGVGLAHLDHRHQHARAELEWLLGDIPAAAALWHRRLDADETDRVAWWGLARCAFGAPEDAPWFGATPDTFTAEEALGRLLAGLVPADAAVAWLGLEGLDADRPILILTAAVVDEMLSRGQIGPALFEALSDAYPEGALAIEAVRCMWCEPRNELLFAVADSYRWPGIEERFDARKAREVLWPEAPAVHGRPDPTWSTLLVRPGGALPIEAAFTGGTPSMAPERAVRWVLASPDAAPIELEGEALSIGGSDEDTVTLPPLEPARVRLIAVGDSWYALSDKPVRVAGHATTERRLIAGQKLVVDGFTFRIHRLAPGQPIPEDADDVVLDLPENWPLGGPHSVLIHRRGTRESRIEFDQDVLALGADPDAPVVEPTGDYLYRLVRHDEGYTLEDRTGTGLSELPPILPLQHGDTFAIGDRTFTFRIQGVQETPAIALSREERKAMVPLLIFQQHGREVTLPILDDVFSIGRGGGNDLQLSDDEVSRHHCMLVRGTDGACILRDAGSANGTYVSGRPVERHILQVGDVIQIGAARLEFRLGRREDLDAESELLLDLEQETTASRADTAAFRRPTRNQ